MYNITIILAQVQMGRGAQPRCLQPRGRTRKMAWRTRKISFGSFGLYTSLGSHPRFCMPLSALSLRASRLRWFGLALLIQFSSFVLPLVGSADVTCNGSVFVFGCRISLTLRIVLHWHPSSSWFTAALIARTAWGGPLQPHCWTPTPAISDPGQGTVRYCGSAVAL